MRGGTGRPDRMPATAPFDASTRNWTMKRFAGWIMASPATLAVMIFLVLPVAATVSVTVTRFDCFDFVSEGNHRSAPHSEVS
jgi:ABC-type sugar transport system permease subunit